MRVVEGIRKLGFRRWHERQLIEAHASLVTGFLCLIVVVICIEQASWRDAGSETLVNLMLIVAGLVLCFHAVRFYFKVLFRAEHFAAQAVCSGCKVYGLIEVLAIPARAARQVQDDTADSDWFKVRCRKCGHGWTISAGLGAASAPNRV